MCAPKLRPEKKKKKKNPCTLIPLVSFACNMQQQLPAHATRGSSRSIDTTQQGPRLSDQAFSRLVCLPCLPQSFPMCLLFVSISISISPSPPPPSPTLSPMLRLYSTLTPNHDTSQLRYMTSRYSFFVSTIQRRPRIRLWKPIVRRSGNPVRASIVLANLPTAYPLLESVDTVCGGWGRRSLFSLSFFLSFIILFYFFLFCFLFFSPFLSFIYSSLT